MRSRPRANDATFFTFPRDADQLYARDSFETYKLLPHINFSNKVFLVAIYKLISCTDLYLRGLGFVCQCS